MKLGASFLPSFCKEEMANFVASCPQNRLWLAEVSTGEVIQTYIINDGILNSKNKGIPLLPDVISTRSPPSEGDVQFTNVTGINERLCVLWSERGLAVMDLSNNGTILGTSCQVGKIQRVRCTHSLVSQRRVEVFVLREAVEGTNQFIRLATYPLIADQLIVTNRISLPELVAGAGRERTSSLASVIERRLSSGKINTPVATSADAQGRGSVPAQPPSTDQERRNKKWTEDIKVAARQLLKIKSDGSLPEEQEGIEEALEVTDIMTDETISSHATENRPHQSTTAATNIPDSWQWFREKIQNIPDTATAVNQLSSVVAGLKVWSTSNEAQVMQPSETYSSPAVERRVNDDLLLAVEVSEVDESVNAHSCLAREVDLDSDSSGKSLISRTIRHPVGEDDSGGAPSPTVFIAPIQELSSISEGEQSNMETSFVEMNDVKSISSTEPPPDIVSMDEKFSRDSPVILGSSSVVTSTSPDIASLLSKEVETGHLLTTFDYTQPTLSVDILESELFEQDMNTQLNAVGINHPDDNKVLSPLSEVELKDANLENSLSSTRSLASLRYSAADAHPLVPAMFSPPDNLSSPPVPGKYEASRRSSPVPPRMYLSGDMLAQCDHLSYHRCPFQCQSLCVTRNALYAVDHRAKLYGCSLRHETNQPAKPGSMTTDLIDFKWTSATSDVVLADSLHVSPCGSVAWRIHRGTVSVYQGTITSYTLIHDSPTAATKRVGSKRAALLAGANQAMSKLRIHRGSKDLSPVPCLPSEVKNVWNEVLHGIRCVDVDNHMGLYVTQSKGELRAHTGLRAGLSYHRTFYLQPPCSHVTDATCLNGVVWALGGSGSKKDTQQVLYARFIEKWRQSVEPGNEDWHQVIIPQALLNMVNRVLLGYQGTAWVSTTDNRWYFTIGVTSTSPQGAGCWFQISLHRFLELSTYDNVNVSQFAVATNSAGVSPYHIQIYTKCSPAMGRHWMGALWFYNETKRIIAVCQSPVLGHRWCVFQPKGLADIYNWKCLTTTFVDDRAYAWCCHASSGEVFCLWGDGNHRSQPLPSGADAVIALAGSDRALWALTETGTLYFLKGVTSSTPMGQRWIQIKDMPSAHFQSIAASSERLWAVDRGGEVFWCEVSSMQQEGSSRGLSRRMGSASSKVASVVRWNSLDKENIRRIPEGIRCISGCLNWNGQSDQTLLWAISCKNTLFALAWNKEEQLFCWNFVPGPPAESVAVTNANVWILSAETHQLYVRCRLSLPERPEGQFWLHIPSPAHENDPPEFGVSELAVTPSNEAWIISETPRHILLRHDTHLLNMSAASPSLNHSDEEITRDPSSQSDNNTFTLKIPASTRPGTKISKIPSNTEDEDGWELINEHD